MYKIKKENTHNPQKKVWADAGIFDTYEEAKAKSESMESETKIRRCGHAGKRYKIKAVKKYLEKKGNEPKEKNSL
tara:strand:+ start:1536 stop:1760 length:225 start_codon:yes stop_codon:yes gene_type:complete